MPADPAAFEKTPAQRRRARRRYDVLKAAYPDAHCELDFEGPFQLLVAVILSAQCTDKRVNMVTPKLFEAYPTPRKLADADRGDLETLIKSTGFYRNKAKSIQGAAASIAQHFDGQVPRDMADLLSLPGVARKTANVVLGVAFGINKGVVVDTHIARISQRLGFTEHTDPKKIERDLMGLFPRKQWNHLGHVLIFHGRRCCKARNPIPDICPLGKACCRVGRSD